MSLRIEGTHRRHTEVLFSALMGIPLPIIGPPNGPEEAPQQGVRPPSPLGLLLFQTLQRERSPESWKPQGFSGPLMEGRGERMRTAPLPPYEANACAGSTEAAEIRRFVVTKWREIVPPKR